MKKLLIALFAGPIVVSLSANALVILALIIFLPVLSGLFYFTRLHALDVALCAFAGLIILTLFKTLKLVRMPRS